MATVRNIKKRIHDFLLVMGNIRSQFGHVYPFPPVQESELLGISAIPREYPRSSCDDHSEFVPHQAFKVPDPSQVIRHFLDGDQVEKLTGS